MATLHPTAAAFVATARERGLDVEVREFPEGTRTAEEAARAVGVDVAQIVKSLAFRAGDEIVMALVSGVNRLDEAKLAAACRVASVGRADARAVRDATGYAIGGVPPFGHATSLDVYVDEDLMRFDVVWAAEGTPHHVFAVAPGDLVRASDGRVADLAAR